MKIYCVSQQINNNLSYHNPKANTSFGNLKMGLNSLHSNKIKDPFLNNGQQKIKKIFNIKETITNLKYKLIDYLNAVKKLLKTEKPLILEQNIQFIPAKNLDDAILFAQKQLKIENYFIDDLDFANNINKALVNIANFFKGKVYFPKTIAYTNSKDIYACYGLMTDELLINKNLIMSSDEDLEEIIEENSYAEAIRGNFGYGYDIFCKLMKQAYKNPSKLNYFDKYSLLETFNNKEELLEKIEDTKRNYNKINLVAESPVFEDFESLIYHEIGHCFYNKSVSFWKIYQNEKIFKAWIKPSTMLENTTEDVDEFVANIFAAKIRGEKYSDETEKKFRDFTGIKK